MEVRVEVAGAADTDGELASLSRWLGAETEFRGRVQLIRSPHVEGQMGGLADALGVALASGGTLTVLASSVSVWLKQRRSTVSVKIVDDAGTSREITASGPAADTLAAKIDPHRRD